MEQHYNIPPIKPQPNGRELGIAGMVLGIMALVTSFIPCLAWWAVLMGITGIVLSAVSMSQAGKVNAPKSMAITGLICSFIAIIVVVIWVVWIAKTFVTMSHELQQSGMMNIDSLSKFIEPLQEVPDTANTH